MTDIVERLRCYPEDEIREAATEIERLRARVEELQHFLDDQAVEIEQLLLKATEREFVDEERCAEIDRLRTIEKLFQTRGADQCGKSR